MTTVTIFKQHNCIRGFLIEGHSDYADYGEDVVCAAISMMAITTLNSLIKIAGIKKRNIKRIWWDPEIPVNGILLKDNLTGPQQQRCRVLLRSFLLGMMQLTENQEYKPFIKIRFRRWKHV